MVLVTMVDQYVLQDGINHHRQHYHIIYQTLSFLFLNLPESFTLYRFKSYYKNLILILILSEVQKHCHSACVAISIRKQLVDFYPLQLFSFFYFYFYSSLYCRPSGLTIESLTLLLVMIVVNVTLFTLRIIQYYNQEGW